MNTYYKYIPNVFLAKCTEQHKRGDVIKVVTKYGKENDCIVYNYIGESKDNHYFYSIVRADGYNLQKRAEEKAQKYNSWAISAKHKSNAYHEASQEGADFLRLGEPIKIGHYSEKRHRGLINRNWNRMSKSVEMQKKADEHEEKAKYWESKAEDINLSIPESLEYFKELVEIKRDYHAGLKSGKYPKEHSYSLTYAKKDLNETIKKYEIAVKLWGEQHENTNQTI